MKIIPLTNNIAQLYPAIEPMRIESIEPCGSELVVSFTSDEPDLYSVPPINIPMVAGEPIKTIVPLRNKGFDKVIKEYHFTMSITSPQHYKDHGLTSPGWISVDTDIPFDCGTRVLDWLPTINPEYEHKINEMLSDELTGDNYDDARAIMERLYDDLLPHMGTPNDKCNRANPFDQYKMAINGESRVQCNNIVDVFIYFCASCCIPARRINLWQGGLWPEDIVKKTGYQLQTAAGHTVAEIYDDDTKQWYLLDPIHGIEAFKMHADWKYLTLAELQIFLSSDDLSETLRISQYKGGGHIGVSQKFKDHPLFGTYRNYLNNTQRIGYVVP